jgi:hypothetical protein
MTTETDTIMFDKFDNDFINKINEYSVESSYIVKNITDSDGNLIDLQTDTELQKWINTQKNKDNLLEYLIKHYFEFTITEIKLSHYRSESDEILVTSHGDFGQKLYIRYKDYIICEKTLCMDDFNFAPKEMIKKNIKNNLENIKNNYIYLSSYIYTNLKVSQKLLSLETKIKSPISVPAVPVIPQVAGNIF